MYNYLVLMIRYRIGKETDTTVGICCNHCIPNTYYTANMLRSVIVRLIDSSEMPRTRIILEYYRLNGSCVCMCFLP